MPACTRLGSTALDQYQLLKIYYIFCKRQQTNKQSNKQTINKQTNNEQTNNKQTNIVSFQEKLRLVQQAMYSLTTTSKQLFIEQLCKNKSFLLHRINYSIIF
jgi:hypothetical protein